MSRNPAQFDDRQQGEGGGMPSFTPTEQRIMDVLKDGLPHTKAELAACLDDDQHGPTAVNRHISVIRRKLEPHMRNVVCKQDGKYPDAVVTYRLARMYVQADE